MVLSAALYISILRQPKMLVGMLFAKPRCYSNVNPNYKKLGFRGLWPTSLQILERIPHWWLKDILVHPSISFPDGLTWGVEKQCQCMKWSVHGRQQAVTGLLCNRSGRVPSRQPSYCSNVLLIFSTSGPRVPDHLIFQNLSRNPDFCVEQLYFFSNVGIIKAPPPSVGQTKPIYLGSN